MCPSSIQKRLHNADYRGQFARIIFAAWRRNSPMQLSERQSSPVLMAILIQSSLVAYMKVWASGQPFLSTRINASDLLPAILRDKCEQMQLIRQVAISKSRPIMSVTALLYRKMPTSFGSVFGFEDKTSLTVFRFAGFPWMTNAEYSRKL